MLFGFGAHTRPISNALAGWVMVTKVAVPSIVVWMVVGVVSVCQAAQAPEVPRVS